MILTKLNKGTFTSNAIKRTTAMTVSGRCKKRRSLMSPSIARRSPAPVSPRGEKHLSIGHRKSGADRSHTIRPAWESNPRTSRQPVWLRSEEHTSELQSHHDLVCRLLLEKKNTTYSTYAS